MTNEELDRKVAEAQGWKPVSHYNPSTNWQQAGELLEKYKVHLEYDVWDNSEKSWRAGLELPNATFIFEYADTPQRAICMAVIASVYGESVDD